MKTIKRVYDNIQLVLRKERVGFISDAQIKTAMNAGETDLYNELLFACQQGKEVPNMLRGFIGSSQVTFPTGLTTDISYLIAVTTDSGYEGVIVKPEEFNSKGIKDLVVKREVKDNLSIGSVDVTLTDGSGDLPSTFIKDRGVFDANGYEGVILSPEEFTERKNDPILPPETEFPIATIEDGTLIVEPSFISNVKVKGYVFPSSKQPVATISGAKYKMQPEVSCAVEYLAQITLSDYVSTPSGKSYIYDDASTIDTPFTNDAVQELTTRALTYLGIVTSQPEVQQLKHTKG